MPLTIRQSTQFRRDVKRLLRSGVDLSKLEELVTALVDQRMLDDCYRDHPLI